MRIVNFEWGVPFAAHLFYLYIKKQSKEGVYIFVQCDLHFKENMLYYK